MTAPEGGCRVVLVGNPNVGKSTVFNALTGLKQHTGNWAGKTVCLARGSYTHQKRCYNAIDLPGMYSLHPVSHDEQASFDFLLGGDYDVVVIVVDATSLRRNLYLALAVQELCPCCLLCLNLMDEAEKKGIRIDRERLKKELKMPVVATTALSGRGIRELKQAIAELCSRPVAETGATAATSTKSAAHDEARIEQLLHLAEAIASRVCAQAGKDPLARDRLLDRLLTSRAGGYPAMLLLLMLIFWITLTGANYPSQWLSQLFTQAEQIVSAAALSAGMPLWLHGLLITGMFRTLGWVVAVMLPPMAIFFPLFTLLEDSGYLPRVAFNLDCYFRRAGAHGKQSLTMCMVCMVLDALYSPINLYLLIIYNN